MSPRPRRCQGSGASAHPSSRCPASPIQGRPPHSPPVSQTLARPPCAPEGPCAPLSGLTWTAGNAKTARLASERVGPGRAIKGLMGRPLRKGMRVPRTNGARPCTPAPRTPATCPHPRPIQEVSAEVSPLFRARDAPSAARSCKEPGTAGPWGTLGQAESGGPAPHPQAQAMLAWLEVLGAEWASVLDGSGRACGCLCAISLASLDSLNSELNQLFRSFLMLWGIT